jgi:predicted Zn-dependent protease
MTFVPRLPDAKVNIPKRKPLVECIQLVCGTAALIGVLYVLMGFAIDSTASSVSTEFEQFIGSKIAETFPQERKYARDEQCLQKILNRLLSLDSTLPQEMTVRVVSGKDANALAIPGNLIVVFAPLIKQAESENELVMILAHELGHFVHRDHLRSLGRGLIGAVIATFVFGEDSPPTQIFVKGLEAKQFHASRSQEHAADLVGITLLHAYYGHVAGAVDFFKRMSANERYSFLDTLFQTHPTSFDRIAALERITRSREYRLGEKVPVSCSQNNEQRGT